MASTFSKERILKVALFIPLFLLALISPGCNHGLADLTISISPTSATQGDPPLTLTVHAVAGGGFQTGDEIFLDGALQSTTPGIDSFTLTISISAALLAKPGSHSVVVADQVTVSNTVTFTVNPKPPTPVITGTNPANATAGGANFPLQVLGTGFVAASTVQVNGNSRTPNSVDVTNGIISVTITNSDIAAAGNLSLTVTNPGNIVSDPFSFKVSNPSPSPAITSINPSTVVGGGPAFTLAINGTNFDSKATVSVNGSVRASAFVTSGNMTVGITAQDIASAGNIPIQVVNPGPLPSNIVNLVVTANPVPTISSVSPVNVAVGGPDFILNVTGTNFLNSSTATVGGVSRVLTVLSSAGAQISVKAADIASVGPISIAITNPPLGGGTATSLLFVVNANPVPTITQLSPPSAFSGDAAFTMNIAGTGFLPSTTGSVNGVSRPVTIVNSTNVQMAMTASDIQNPGSLNIAVTNPPIGGGTSNTAVFTVIFSKNVAPVPVLLTLQPSAVGAGNSTFNVIVGGTGFVPVSVVSINGTPRATTFMTPTSLAVTLTPADDAVVATLPVVVTNPPIGGGTSNTMSIVVNPAGTIFPSLLSLSPTQVVPGSPGFTLNVNPTFGNYTGDPIQIDGQSRATTFVQTPFSVTANILDSDLVTPRIAQIRMFFDAAHNGPAVSNFLPLTIEPTGNPVPSVASVARNAIVAGGPSFVTEVDGTNFIPSTTIGVNGFPRPTTFVNSTTVNATILAEDIAAPGTLLVNAVNPPPGGGTSFTQTITVTPHPGPPTSTISGAFTAYLQGVTGSANSATKTIAQLQFVADGQGHIMSGTIDQFIGGVSPATADISGSTITADANFAGRMTIHLNAHGAATVANDLTAYVDSTGSGTVVAGMPGNPTPQLGLGAIAQQSSGLFSEASFGSGCKLASVPASFTSGSKNDGTSLSGNLDFSTGAVVFAGTFDVAAAGETAAARVVTGSFTISDPATGRFAGRISGLPGGEQSVVGYLQSGDVFSFVLKATGQPPTLMVCGGK